MRRILSDELVWRERWIKFVQDGLASYTRELCEAVHAVGSHDMTYNMMDDIHDPFEWHEEKFRALEKMRPYFEKLGNVSRRTKGDGLCCFVSKKSYNKPLKVGSTLSDLNREYSLSSYHLLRDGLPLVYEENERSVFLLHPDVAAIMSADEVEALKKRKVITCGESVAILNQRGFDIGLLSTPVEPKNKRALAETYEPHPVCGNVSDRFCENYYTQGRFEPHVLSGLPKSATVLGRYKHNVCESDPINGSVATAILPL